jgi:glutathione synthase/RimK-type ligase-like ATP-grasp enzyme
MTAEADVWFLDRFSESWENKALCSELARRGYQAEIVDWENLAPSGGRASIVRAGIPGDLPRLAVVKSRVITRRSDNELALIYDSLDAFADAGTRFSNSPAAIRRCHNKIRQAATLARAGLPVPLTRAIRTQDDIEACMADWGEVVLKPIWGHASIDVTRMRPGGRLVEPGTLLGMREEIVSWHLLDHHRMLCAQPFIDNPGRDLRVTVIGSCIASCVYHVSTSPDRSVRHFLYPLHVENAVLTDEIGKIALSALAALDLRFAVIDMVEGPSGPVLIEVNEGLPVYRTIENTEYDLTPHGHTMLITDQLEQLLADTIASSSVPAPNRITSSAGKPVSSATRASS